MKPRKRIYPMMAAAALALTGMGFAQQISLPDRDDSHVLEARLVPVPTPSTGLRVGQIVNVHQLHQVSRPGLYGISQSPGGRYGIIDGRLIRFDPDTMRVQSIIREVDQVLD